MQLSGLFPVRRVIGLHQWLRLILFHLQIWQHFLYPNHDCYNIEILIKFYWLFYSMLTNFFISVTFFTFFNVFFILIWTFYIDDDIDDYQFIFIVILSFSRNIHVNLWQWLNLVSVQLWNLLVFWVVNQNSSTKISRRNITAYALVTTMLRHRFDRRSTSIRLQLDRSMTIRRPTLQP